MNEQHNQIRDQQRQTWDEFSPGWKKWDDLVLGWLASVGEELLRVARLKDDSHLLDVAAGTGEPGLTAAAILNKGKVTITDLSEGMLRVAAENATRRGVTNLDARQIIDAWRDHYNTTRPHSSLGYLSPTVFESKVA